MNCKILVTRVVRITVDTVKGRNTSTFYVPLAPSTVSDTGALNFSNASFIAIEYIRALQTSTSATLRGIHTAIPLELQALQEKITHFFVDDIGAALLHPSRTPFGVLT